MLFLGGSVLLAALVTLGAARWLTLHRPAQSVGAQVMLAAASFPLLACALFAVGLAVALLGLSRSPDLPGRSEGMPIFALVMFLFYALFVGVVVGLPTAVVAVRMFRGR